MNWNSRYTSVKEIIGKVYRDMGMADQINFADAVEWAGEAIELIGAPFHLLDKSERLTIANYRAELPCDLHYIVTTRGLSKESTTEDACDDIETGSFMPMRYSTDAYHHWYCNNANFKDTNCQGDYTYKVNDNFIFTNFETGFVLLAYKGIPVDDDGFPKIPDDPKFKNAVAYHIMWKMAFIRSMQGKMPAALFQKIEQDRDWYMGAAQTRGQMPSVDMAESIKNNWIRLIPKINQHQDGFKSAGHQEERYTHNSGLGGSTNRDTRTDSDETYFHIDGDS